MNQLNDIKVLICLLLLVSALTTCTSPPVGGTISEENTGTVTGNVRYDNNQPVQDAEVRIHRVVDRVEDSLVVTRTDDAGVFSVEGLKTGDYIIEVVREFTGDLEHVTLPGADSTATVDLFLGLMGVVYGKIDTALVREKGPVVILLPEINREVTVADNGSFEMSGLAAASYHAVIVAGSDTLWGSGENELLPVVAGRGTQFKWPEAPFVKTDTAPFPQSGVLECTLIEPTRVAMKWKPFAAGLTTEVYRKRPGQENDTLLTITGDTAVIDSSLVPATSYCYSIISRDEDVGRCYRSPALTVTTADTGIENALPVTGFVFPAHDTAVLLGAEVTLSIAAYDLDGTIVQPLVMIDETVTALQPDGPYQVTWHASEMKKYSAVAGAVDDNGDTAWSAPVYLYVDTLLRGDVNSDGYITIVDAELIAQYSVDLPLTLFAADAADVDGDGAIDIVDALIVAQLSDGTVSLVPWYQTADK